MWRPPAPSRPPHLHPGITTPRHLHPGTTSHHIMVPPSFGDIGACSTPNTHPATAPECDRCSTATVCCCTAPICRCTATNIICCGTATVRACSATCVCCCRRSNADRGCCIPAPGSAVWWQGHHSDPAQPARPQARPVSCGSRPSSTFSSNGIASSSSRLLRRDLMLVVRSAQLPPLLACQGRLWPPARSKAGVSLQRAALEAPFVQNVQPLLFECSLWHLGAVVA